MAGVVRGSQSRGLAILREPLGRLLQETFQQYGDEIRHFLLLRVRDRQVADDLMQDVFADVAQWLASQGRAPESMVRLLQAVAVRRASDFWRLRAEYAESSELSELADTFPDRRRVGEAVGAALRAVPPMDRRVVAMRMLQGCCFREIAEATHSTEAACRMRFSRGTLALRTLLVAALGVAGLDIDLLL
jgi:DNA-directed RNA polymerase specialized sigma24 family protein